MKKTVILAAALWCLASGQSERWVYTYDGPAHGWDQAWKVTCRADTTVYACGDGQLNALPLTFDMTVVGLTSAGSERWVHRYNGPGGFVDQAYDVVCGTDGNLYVAGSSFDFTTSNDFTVLSVTDSGARRWVYRYAPAGIDLARALVQGADRRIFAAGTSEDYAEFTVVCLTDSGGEEWVYRGGPGEALAIAAGPDSAVYAAGFALDSVTGADIMVVGVRPDGSEKWRYTYDGPGHAGDTAWAITFGPEGALYVAGQSMGAGTGLDFAVIRLDPANGHEDWAHRYNGPGNSFDLCASVAAGQDVYAGGTSSVSDSFALGFTVLALSSAGDERWVYTDTGGRAAALNLAASLTCDPDGNVYAAGTIAGTETTRMDAGVVGLSPEGTERWRYRYAGPDTFADNFSSVAFGPDGNLYLCGTTGPPPNSDWVVVSLTAAGAVREERTARPGAEFRAPTVFLDEIRVRAARPLARPVAATLVDAAGRTVLRRSIAEPGSELVLAGPEVQGLPPGLYFLRVEAGNSLARLKLIKPVR